MRQTMPLVSAVLFSFSACAGDGVGAPDPVVAPIETASTTTSTEPSGAPSSAPAAQPDTQATTTTDPLAGGLPVVEQFAGKDWFLGEVPAQAVTADLDREPIRLGMINQEETELGSYPELRVAVEAAVTWINQELGGVSGRPLELLTCVTPFDPVQSRDCARDLLDAEVTAFVGGVNVTADDAIREIEAAGNAVFGGIPATLAEQRSDRFFAFSGADVGALAAFVSHIADTGGSSVVIAYGAGVPSFEVAARDYGKVTAETLGLRVELVPYPIFTEDPADVFDAAAAVDADAVVVLAATSSCAPFISAAVASGRRLYLTGACAGDGLGASSLVADADAEVFFNAEGSFTDESADAAIFDAVIRRYAEEPASGAGTVGFRGMMNLYALLLEAGAAPTTETLIALARAPIDRPSFWGHPYRCDGAAVPGLPALCAPQQIIFTVAADGVPVGVTDWIATDELFVGIEPGG